MSKESAGRPDVSVVVAIKNSEPYLTQALDSIAAQSFGSYEIVVVDGNSTDDGPAIARSYSRTVCIQQNGIGFANAWNVGISESRAPFITFLDSDDIWLPDKLALQLAMFEQNPALEYVYGRVAFFLEPGHPLPRGFRPDILNGSHLIPTTGTAMIRRSTIDRMKPFPEQWGIVSDVAWFADLRETSVVDTVNEVLLRKRLHGSNLGVTTSPTVFKSELLQVLKLRIDQRRDAAGR